LTSNAFLALILFWKIKCTAWSACSVLPGITVLAVLVVRFDS
jgi:hypothetical protein